MMLATAPCADEPTPSASLLESWLEGPALTGNWWGARDDLAAKGVSLDLGFTQFYQGPVAGDGDHDWKYGGKPEYILDVDFGKLGLWNGFGTVMHGEYNNGRTPAGAGGTILPTNTAMTFPDKNDDGGDLTSLFLRQRFGRLAVLSVGKINMIDVYASGREFSGGRGGDRFGVAAFYLGVSDDLKDGLRRDRLGDEYGGEMFYNLAVTRWFRVTADLQVISPALGDSPVVLLGWRAQLRF